ncbi:uncharacterized protein B0H64DRAFT_364605 [Chaetomium fimeti]|uniref:Uncharacterized protein n=1 Tax=Chaetomium fimeti TaxID=1854472 RepID=A0AAE0LR41_9PEZI|nr:hypothetical protein B0H64DRAFT_364605 [Chaetomium fimeti]
MPCRHYNTHGELTELEEQAESASGRHQTTALGIIASIFNNAGLAYALMGGMNFYLRGSGRTTQDVDLAVNRRPSLGHILDLLNNESRPGPNSRMLWASGVARIFVRVNSHVVQLDLKSQSAEGHGMPYAPAVREIADRLSYNKRCEFAEEVGERNPEDEEIVIWAMKLDRSPSPESDGGSQGRSTHGGHGGGNTHHDSRDSRDNRHNRDTRATRERRGDPRESGSGGHGVRERRPAAIPSSRRPTSGRGSDELTSRMQRMHVSSGASGPRAEPRPLSTTIDSYDRPAPEPQRRRRTGGRSEYN